MKRIRTLLQKYCAVAVINLHSSTAYTGEVAMRSIMITVILYVLVHLWKAAYSASGATAISGLTVRDTLWYLVLTETIILSKSAFSTRISEEVRDGSLAYTIMRPYNYILYHMSYSLGDSLVKLLMNFAAGALVVLLLEGPPQHFTIVMIPFLLISVILALVLDFCFEGLIGLCAFILEDVSSLQLIYNKILFILGGMLIPLDFFPGWLAALSKALPFNLVLYGPARIFVRGEISAALTILFLQCLWITVMATILFLLYRKAVKYLSINGG